MNNNEKINNHTEQAQLLIKAQYNTGAVFWRDTAFNHGIDEAIDICIRYFSIQLKTEISDDEKQFCRDLFNTMYEATANNICLRKIVYPYPFEEAHKNIEASYYHESRKLNEECARAIDETIRDSCYEVNYYNLETAAWVMILTYDFERVNTVLAHQIQKLEHDGRYSRKNKEWAQGFDIIEKAFDSAYLNSHAILVDGFTDHIRKLYRDLDTRRFALPGKEENSENVHGYEITRSIMFDNKGFAIGYNPNAVSPYVCWCFKVENGERDYFWGEYGEEQDAVNKYLARVFIQISDEKVEKI